MHSSGDIWAHFRFLIFFWGWLLLNIHCLSKYMVIEEEIIWNLSIYTCFSIISFLLQHQRLGKPKIIFIFTSGKRIFFWSSVIVLSTEWLKCVCYFHVYEILCLKHSKVLLSCSEYTWFSNILYCKQLYSCCIKLSVHGYLFTPWFPPTRSWILLILERPVKEIILD